MSSLVHRAPGAGPRTHALVIGVGSYPHLLGGSSSRTCSRARIGQLSSPPVSARAIASWLIDSFRNDDRPLGTVRLLLSDKGGDEYSDPRSGETLQVPDASIVEVRRAVDEWIADGDQNPDNLMLFFFAGHGIAAGEVLSLLLSDFCANENRPFEGAIDFLGFHNGMKRCKALWQCFFIDACRIGSKDLLTDTGDYAGDPLVHAGLRDFSLRRAPVYYSTIVGKEAFGLRGDISFFTDALLRSMEGAASDDPEGEWWVDTAQLHRALEFYLQYAITIGHSLDQRPLTNHLASFRLSRIDDPTAPVLIGCEPADLNDCVDLWYEIDATRESRDDRDTADWLVELPVRSDEYRFGAECDDPRLTQPNPVSHSVRPPYRRAVLRT